MTNRDRVLSFVRNNPGHTQQEISRSLGVTPEQQVNQILRSLMREDLVSREEKERPYRYFPRSTNVQVTSQGRHAEAKEQHIPKTMTPDNALIIVSCTRLKIWEKNSGEKEIYKKAKDAYIGGHDWFQKFKKELERKRPDFPWLILSAKYGFIEPEHPIHNYDVTFAKPDTGPISIESLKNQVLYQARLLGGIEQRLCKFKYVLVKESGKREEKYFKNCQAVFPSTTSVLKLTESLWMEITEKI